ncbi:unnamed protein product [Pleuronectes platessa]|uniref:Uncharacterized protein n=1 Tax=Pleuronectes platessa TaxID=8262 RepID=A0A9N7VMR0_PLEPL|nr:unnamed protein product [Pleuronectes platessa]
MSGLVDSQCGARYAFVSWIISGSAAVVWLHERIVRFAGHRLDTLGLVREHLNAKQLRRDRGNGISIAANRFGRRTEARCAAPHFSVDLSPNRAGAYQSAAKTPDVTTAEFKLGQRRHWVCGELGPTGN